MKDKQKMAYVGLDASKDTLAVSVADDGRDGEIRDWGTVSTAPVSVEKLLNKLGPVDNHLPPPARDAFCCWRSDLSAAM